MRPEFADNQDGRSLEKALRALIEHVSNRSPRPDVSIATGYFNPEGYLRIARDLRELKGVRILLGAEPFPAAHYPVRKLGEPVGLHRERLLAREMLDKAEQRLKEDRDHLPFARETRSAVEELLADLGTGRVQVRRYTKRFLHGKAFILSDEEGLISGSSNFTAAGLTSNLELNLGNYQPSAWRSVKDWFEALWDEAEEYDLSEIYKDRFTAYPPYLIYLKALWQRYGKELEDEAEITGGRIQLTGFQKDGVLRARRILDELNGVIVADSVGLGKSFIAAEIFMEVIERRRQRALLIAPAQLRDGMWARFAQKYQSGIEVISIDQLATEAQLGEGDGSYLSADIKDYSLIVVDEAHAFRNPDTKRARALRRLLRGDPPKKVVLLTATPVNNSLWDLYDLLTFFVHHDAVFAEQGIPSLRARFQEASRIDPYTLSPELLFDVIDETTVRRTRSHVMRHYPGDHFKDGDGNEIAIRFPEPKVRSATYDLSSILPSYFERFAHLLDPENPEGLKLARYQPGLYLPEGPDGNEITMAGLIRSGLLKRFESSVHAFRTTLGRMILGHEEFLRALEHGYIPTSRDLEVLRDTDTDEAWEEVFEDHDIERAPANTERLKAAVESDLRILEELLETAAPIEARQDPKLKLLERELVRIAKEAHRDRLSDNDERQRRKVLVFSYFADTIGWVRDHLEQALATNHELASYRGRIAVVAGAEAEKGERSRAVFGFAPISTEAPPSQSEDRFDILLTTDVLAEGMNLQQAGRIINYDLPWNPMRLVQRHGRIDRIGSPHEQVELTCIFPDRELDELLTLEERIRTKLAQAAASIGLDQIVFPGAQIADHVYADDREEIDRLRREDPSLFAAGGEVGAQSGEEFRQELRQAISKQYGDRIKDLPWGVGAVMRRQDRRNRTGDPEGFTFCADVYGRTFYRFVSKARALDEIPEDPAAGIERETLRCLSLMACAEDCQGLEVDDDVLDLAYCAWKVARDDIFAEWEKSTDPANLSPRIRPLFRSAAHQVRLHPPPNLSLPEIDEVAAALEAPLPIKIERDLRRFFTGELGDEALSGQIVEWVREIGLQPWHPPEPLDPIDPSDVTLVCFLGSLEAP